MGLDELAYIGLGANVGAPRASLTHAVAALGVLPGADLAGVSRLYRTRPVGPVAQADFLNAAVGLRVPTGSTPAEGAMALLIALKGIERELGRLERERWGPREVDLDLLTFGNHRIHVERDATARSDDPARPGEQWLDVPHPAAAERLFVLAPLADLAPELTPPGWLSTVQETGTRALNAEGPDAVTPIARWDRDAEAWVDAAD